MYLHVSICHENTLDSGTLSSGIVNTQDVLGHLREARCHQLLPPGLQILPRGRWSELSDNSHADTMTGLEAGFGQQLPGAQLNF